jgi:uncharacterized protein (DUF302 family)
MQETAYGLRIVLQMDYQTAIERTTTALKAEGFGVLTTIDVQQTLRVKLNRDFRKYVILGACNPVLAERALHAELEIGLLLPCNVIVYESKTRRDRRRSHGALVGTRSCRRQPGTANHRV